VRISDFSGAVAVVSPTFTTQTRRQKVSGTHSLNL
jgi:hypothetical protein